MNLIFVRVLFMCVARKVVKFSYFEVSGRVYDFSSLLHLASQTHSFSSFLSTENLVYYEYIDHCFSVQCRIFRTLRRLHVFLCTISYFSYTFDPTIIVELKLEIINAFTPPFIFKNLKKFRIELFLNFSPKCGERFQLFSKYRWDEKH